jgi:hypothetical protein
MRKGLITLYALSTVCFGMTGNQVHAEIGTSMRAGFCKVAE